MRFEVDWQHGAEHMHDRHQVSVKEANEALADAEGLAAVRPGPEEQVRGQCAGDRLLAHSRRRPRGDPGTPRGQAGGVVGRKRVACQQRRPANVSRKDAVMTSDAKQLVEQIAAEADSTRDAPMPADATPTKPHKTITVATRLTIDDVAQIEALADRLDVPVSALVRGWILAGLAGGKEDSVTTALDRLSADVQRLRELVA
jgi:hypothetical protein